MPTLSRPSCAEAAVDPERCVDELRLLHVDADERPFAEQPAHVRVRELLVDLEPEVRELQRDVRAQLLGRDPVEHLLVRRDDPLGLPRLEDALAEQRRVRVQPLLVQAAEHGDALVERLAGDEARGAEPHAVPPDERTARVCCRRQRGSPSAARR